MAETLEAVRSFQSVASEMATMKAINFFGFNPRRIKEIEAKMEAFNSILNDVKEKQCTPVNVKDWLVKLQAVSYDAKVVLEKILIEYQAVQEGQGSCSSSRDQLTEELEPKLLGIREKLENLAEDSAALGLSKAVGEKRSSEKRETTLIDELEGFYGRDADKKAIIDMLISEHDDGSRPGVIPIVGPGGLGKTTLAQHVYNDKALEEQFKIRAWVCVSDHFDETKLTEEIVKKVTGTACPYDDLDQLQHKLKEALDGKKFLLVLDDVWSEDYEEWRQLLTPMRSGAKGSKLVITTRSQVAAWMVRTVPTHNLRELEDEDCWKLFARHASSDVNCTANRPEFEGIGRKIVSKCEGLPLAVKALRGVLRRQTRAEKWTEVLESDIWDDKNVNILPALKMSYIHLPSHLKRCFSYCAMFPQGYEFDKEELVALWISQNFVVQQMGNQSPEETGEEYFDELVSRSFLQHSSNSGGKPCFVMHDLVHKLARFVYGEFCSRLGDGTSGKIGKRARHFSYEITKEDVPKKFQRIHETPSLRSFVLAQQPRVNCRRVNPDICIDGLLQRGKLLRVLSLSCWEIKKLPDSIDNLKHMRQLDLSSTSITSLEAVTALLNLKILILRECYKLEELPPGMARLINLCQIDLQGINLPRMPLAMGELKKLSKLTDFVVGGNGGSSIAELRKLHYLRGKISIRGLENVKNDGSASQAILKDKKSLKVLQLEWNGDADDSSQVEKVLGRLEPHFHIECIKIWGYGGREFPNWVGDISFSKLKQLQIRGCKKCIHLPPLGQLPSLEELSIDGETDGVLEAIGPEFYGKCEQGKWPFSSLKKLEFEAMKKWREWSSCNGAFPLLEELKLRYCPELMSVPSQLPRLKRLVIEGCGKLDIENLLISTCATLETIRMSCKYPWIEKVISLASHGQLASLEMLKIVGFYGLCKPGEKGVPSLETIKFRGMLNWREWSSCDEAFPFLEELELNNCPKLMSIPNLHRLKRLQIEDCPELELREDCPKSVLVYLPNLKQLSIKHTKNWREWSSSNGAFPVLKELELRDCPELLSVPSHLPSLKRLRIRGCGELDFKNLSSSTRSTLEIIEIWGSDKVNCMSVETFPKLKELHMRNCSNLESLGSTATRKRRRTRRSDPLISPSLTSLTISDCSKLVSFPRGFRAPNLKSMQIYECRNLQSLHSDLSSLEELELKNCPKLLSVPHHLPSLKRLWISGCDELNIKDLSISTLETILIIGSGKLKCISLENFPNLKELDIQICSNLVGSTAARRRRSSPSPSPSLTSLTILGGLGAPKLKSMRLSGWRNLNSLPEGMHSLLPSLEKLSIYDCPEIGSFPDGGLPSSLSSLHILGCPLLKERCEREIGEDWPKIKDIPHLFIV